MQRLAKIWCLNVFWKSQDSTDVNRTCDIQIFDDGIFLIDGLEKLSHNCNSIAKADATNATMLFESKDYFLFVFCGELTIFPKGNRPRVEAEVIVPARERPK